MLRQDGYPTGAAWRFAVAQRKAADAPGFLVAFLSPQQQAEPLASLELGPNAEYRYRVHLLPGPNPFTAAVLALDPRRLQLDLPLQAHAVGGLDPAPPAR